MALEQVFAERDSEDEVDDDVADLEDRRVCMSKFQFGVNYKFGPCGILKYDRFSPKFCFYYKFVQSLWFHFVGILVLELINLIRVNYTFGPFALLKITSLVQFLKSSSVFLQHLFSCFSDA